MESPASSSLTTPITLLGLPEGITLVRKRFGRKVYWGVAKFVPEEEEPFTYKVRYLDSDTETMSREEVCSLMPYSWDEVPKKKQSQLKALARGQAPGNAIVTRPIQLRAADGTIVRRKFKRRVYYGVACHDHAEPPPYTYRVCYEDDDTELMTAAEVLRHRVPSTTRVPLDKLDRLRSLGAIGLPPVTTNRDTNATNSNTNAQTMQADAPNRQGPSNNGATMTTPEQRQARARARRHRRRIAGLTRTANMAWTQTGMKIGCVNVCGLTQTNACELKDVLQRLSIDIMDQNPKAYIHKGGVRILSYLWV
jgi:hypothetical protein